MDEFARKLPEYAEYGRSKTHPAAATTGQHPNPVPHIELLAGTDFLNHGDGATMVKADGDFDAIAGAHRLLGVGANGSTHQGAANGACRVGGSAIADIAAEKTTGQAANKRAGLIAAFDFNRTDCRNAPLADRLRLTRLVARIGVSCQGVLGT